MGYPTDEEFERARERRSPPRSSEEAHVAAFTEECKKRGIIVQAVERLSIGTETHGPVIFGGIFNSEGMARDLAFNIAVEDALRDVRERFGLPREWEVSFADLLRDSPYEHCKGCLAKGTERNECQRIGCKMLAEDPRTSEARPPTVVARQARFAADKEASRSQVAEALRTNEAAVAAEGLPKARLLLRKAFDEEDAFVMLRLVEHAREAIAPLLYPPQRPEPEVLRIDPRISEIVSAATAVLESTHRNAPRNDFAPVSSDALARLQRAREALPTLISRSGAEPVNGPTDSVGEAPCSSPVCPGCHVNPCSCGLAEATQRREVESTKRSHERAHGSKVEPRSSADVLAVMKGIEGQTKSQKLFAPRDRVRVIGSGCFQGREGTVEKSFCMVTVRIDGESTTWDFGYGTLENLTRATPTGGTPESDAVKCKHGRWPWEGCEHCTDEVAPPKRGTERDERPVDAHADAMARGYTLCRELCLAALHDWPAIQVIVDGKLGPRPTTPAMTDAVWLNHRFEMAKSDVRFWKKLLDEATPSADWKAVDRVRSEMARAVEEVGGNNGR